jgi:hypothetical protein
MEKKINPATFDTITLYDLSEANAHIRRYSVYQQWKELKKYYPSLTASEHAQIIKQYINQKNEK